MFFCHKCHYLLARDEVPHVKNSPWYNLFNDLLFFFHLSTNKNIEMLRIRIFYKMKIINTSFYAN